PFSPDPLVITESSGPSTITGLLRREFTYESGGQALLTNFKEELGSGVVARSGVVGGNSKSLVWEHPTADPATHATLPKFERVVKSDGVIRSTSVNTYDDSTGFLTSRRSHKGSVSGGVRRKVEYLYATT